MLEPAVTLTDYGLTIECWLFAALIARTPSGGAMRSWWMAFFALIGAASLLGGTVHGFFPDESALVYRLLWDANLVAIGGTAVAVWNLGALLSDSARLKRYLPPLATGALLGYTAVVVFVSDEFLVAIAMYLPATIFLTVAMVMAHRREPARGWATGIVGLGLTFIAAAVQQLRLAAHPVYFDHNALYHAIQAVALYLIYRGQSEERVLQP